MSAVNKLSVSFYYERERFIIWCIKHKPDLLRSVFQPFSLPINEWREWQVSMDIHYGVACTALPIANFTSEENRYLYWHCPFGFVREYLHEQCGYTDNWFVKLFWKK